MAWSSLGIVPMIWTEWDRAGDPSQAQAPAAIGKSRTTVLAPLSTHTPNPGSPDAQSPRRNRLGLGAAHSSERLSKPSSLSKGLSSGGTQSKDRVARQGSFGSL